MTNTAHPGRAIITYGRSLMSLVIAHSLHKRGVEVISCDSVGMTATGFSKYTESDFVHADPDKDEALYFQDLLSAIEKHAPDDDRPYILIPAFRDAKRIARHSAKFDGRITVATPEFASIDQVDPKHHLVKTLNDLSVGAPKTWHPTTQEALEAALSDISLPALIKAVDEVGGRGIDFFKVDETDRFASTAKARMVAETPPPLLQEAAPGGDYCLAVLYEHGVLKAHMAYHNLQTMPSEGAAGAMRETIDDAPFLKAANTLMDKVGWHGVAEIDFMWTGNPEDEPLLIEVNPRFWAGLFQSVESGIDFPWMLYQLFAYGHVDTAPEPRIGTKTKVPGVWAAGALKEALSGDIDIDGAREAWNEMKTDLKAGDFQDAFRSLQTSLSRLTDISDAMAFLKAQNTHAHTARSELNLSDDPMSSLGIFFVLSSLIRHGELPAELRN